MSLLDSGFSTLISLSHRMPLDLGPNNRAQNRDVAQAIINTLSGAASRGADAMVVNANQTVSGASGGATLLLSGGIGTITATISGVAVNQAFATSDANTCGLLATAIRTSVDPLLVGLFGATNIEARVTLTSVAAGARLEIGIDGVSTYVFTATAAATGRLGEFSISGTDAADATALATAINAYPVLNHIVRAEAISNVCHLHALDGVAAGKRLGGTGITLTAATFAAAGRVHVHSLQQTTLANSVTFAASGTGASVANANARLVGGQGGNSSVTRLCNLNGAR